MKTSQLRIVFSTALLALAPMIACANHVDFYEDGAFGLATSSGSSSQLQTGLPTGTVLGGQRVSILTKTTGGNGNSVSASLSQGSGGNLDDNDVSVLFSGNGNARGTLLFQYGQATDLNANFLDIPNSANDWDRLRVTFGAASTSITLTVDLFSRENGGLSSLTQTYAGGAGNVDFLYSNFNGGAGLTADFLRNVDRASLLLATDSSTSNSFSYSLQSFNRNGPVAPAATTVPEPGTLLLLGAALAGMVLVKRRSRV